MSIQHITYNMYMRKQHIQLRTSAFSVCAYGHITFFLCSCYVNVHPK